MPLLAQIQPDAVPLGGDAKGSAALDEQYRKLDRLASFLRTRNAKQFAITSVKDIDEASYVRVGGIEQWVTIRGQDRANPVLLFLHGGPWRCNESLGICNVCSLGEAFYGGPVGSARCGQNTQKSRPRGCTDDDT